MNADLIASANEHFADVRPGVHPAEPKFVAVAQQAVTGICIGLNCCIT